MFESNSIRAILRLYAVTDRSWLRGRSLKECAEKTIEGGATCVQLREKHTDSLKVETLARELKELCDEEGVPLLINDDVALAHAIGADGVHIGQDDIGCEKARSILSSTAIIGVSVQTVDEALKAEAAGADYLGVGALFGTPTKPEAAEVSLKTLREICKQVSIPVIGIGGLNRDTIPKLAGTGIVGVAVVSAIFAADDIRSETAHLLKLTSKL